MAKLDGKVAIIMGASSGIGEANQWRQMFDVNASFTRT